MPLRLAYFTVLISCLLMFAFPASGYAAATLNSGTWQDPTGDSPYPYVDITATILGYYDDDSITITVGTRPMIGGDRIAIYVDIDQNASTGYLGADVAFYYEKYISGDHLGTGVWNGASFTIVTPQTVQYAANGYGVSIAITRQELGAASAINVFSRGGHAEYAGSGVRDVYWDWAPNSASYPLSLSGVGGVSGGGDSGGDGSTPTPTPTAFLTLAEARNTAARGMHRKLGSTTRATVASTCARVSSVKRRCVTVGRRSGYIWRGATTVREYVSGGVIHRSYVFSGWRYRSTCASSSCPRRYTSYSGSF